MTGYVLRSLPKSQSFFMLILIFDSDYQGEITVNKTFFNSLILAYRNYGRGLISVYFSRTQVARLSDG